MQERWIVTGYKGVLASHVECRSKLELPISVAIGNKIFYHIVESANVANRILYWKKHLDISGEFNFIPLDKIYVEDVEYPTSKIATPLLGKIQYPKELQPAFRVSFSKHSKFNRLALRGNLPIFFKLAQGTEVYYVQNKNLNKTFYINI